MANNLKTEGEEASDKTVLLSGNFDACSWAREWLKAIKINPEISTDEGAMIGWFANAIMAGYDHAQWEKEEELTASEALYGFAGWLTSRREPVTLSAAHEAGIAAELVDEFCKANGLAEPRPDWTKNLTHPTTNPDLKDIEFVN